MKARTLPSVIAQLFLAGDGFLGYRCDACAFVATGRTPEAVDAGMTEHYGFSHCEPLDLLAGDDWRASGA